MRDWLRSRHLEWIRAKYIEELFDDVAEGVRLKMQWFSGEVFSLCTC
jgi:hypothetical protein